MPACPSRFEAQQGRFVEIQPDLNQFAWLFEADANSRQTVGDGPTILYGSVSFQCLRVPNI